MEALKVQTIWQWSIGTWCMGFQFTSFCRHSSLTTVDMKHCPRSVHHNLLQNARKWFCWTPFMQMLCRRHTAMSIMFQKKSEKYFRECLLEKYFPKWFRPPAMRLLGLRRAIPTAVPSFLSFFETNKPSSKRSHQENQTPANYQKWASDVLAMLSVYKKTCIGN